MSLARYNNIENSVYIIGFIAIKYLDYISYIRTFKYLKDNFNFNPIVIHTDFEKSLGIAIKKANFFNKEIINIKSFFHFVISLMGKLKKYGYCKKNNTKEIYAILNNIKLICFVDINKLDEYKIFLIKKLEEYHKYDKFISYLKSFRFKKDNNEYNYSIFINKFIKDESKMNKLFITNNILEDLHSKLNLNSFLKKNKIYKFDFIIAMRNVFINEFLSNINLIRYDFKTKSLINLVI